MGKVMPIDQRVVKMYEAGHSLREIAAKLGRSVRYPLVHLEKAGIKTRPSHGHEFHKQYRGGRVQTTGSYWRQKIAADDPFASMRNHHGYVLEHRLVLARKLGRPLRKNETVHHIDGNRQNNTPENLQLRHGQHGRGSAMVCLDCGSHNVGHRKLS